MVTFNEIIKVYVLELISEKDFNYSEPQHLHLKVPFSNTP